MRHAFAILALTVAALTSCAHDTADVQSKLDTLRTRMHSGERVDAATAIAWADAVGAALTAGVAHAEDGDLDDALYALRVAGAAAVDDPAPVHEATGRLLLAAGRDADSDAAFREAAKAKPSPSNAMPLLIAAGKQKQAVRARALCVAGAFIVDDGSLPAWLEAGAKAAETDKKTMRGWWFPSDQGRLDGTPAPDDACVKRCRIALYRGVAACAADDCLTVMGRANDICVDGCK